MTEREPNARERTRLRPEDLTWTCPEKALGFDSTDSVTPVEGTIGQDRALRALRLGLELYSPGYNIFVSGLLGTGRTTTVKDLLAEISPRCSVPRDRAYVRNFGDPDRPRLLTFGAGRAAAFAREMKEFVGHMRERLPAVFEEKEVTARRAEIEKRFEQMQQAKIEEFQDLLKSQGFALVSVQAGPMARPDVFPTHDGKPLPPDAFESLVEEGKVPGTEAERVRERLPELQGELRERLRQGRDLAREMSREIESLHRDVGLGVIEGELEDLREHFGDFAGVTMFLDEVQKDILENLPLLASREEGETAQAVDQFYRRYEVNVLSDHGKTRGCPVVIAANPTHTSLFGTIERVMEAPGVFRTDHTMIKGGAVLDADGGYLLVNALDVLQQPGVWPVLMRTLKCRQLEIGLPEFPFLGMTTGLKPEAIDLNLKVVLIGEPWYFEVLYRNDPDFRKIFKIKADFTPDMELKDENIEHFAKVVARICEKEGLKHLSREALGKLVEENVRLAGRRDRLSTRFAQVADIVREADYWCREEGEIVVKRRHVQRALDERAYRMSSLDSRIQELMEKDVLIIRTEGTAVGQVNGLSVYDLGYHSFGKPTLITASTAVGQTGIISIEREARLSGGIYDKGVLIISGWLRRMFARRRPLALTASLCFEQSYSGVDGDSASITEIFALLSDLSGIPVDQGFAVTGSINQMGEIQPIGGANEKIEGFFNLCRARGLTGSQGVIIPRRNVHDLMLPDALVEEVRNGRFHIHAISSVEEGIEILTGIPAGVRGEGGEFPEGTIYHLVDRRLGE
ncbi:MAG: AAA family ATPase, partial [Planctomycetes bacterium]|nr:AAA family ATPase [Planctomycetota bacterium]